MHHDVEKVPDTSPALNTVGLPELTDWRWAAITYKKRLENSAIYAAFAAYCAMVYLLGSLLEQLRVDSVWTETIGSIAWLPLGFVAYMLRNWLEDWLVRVDAKK